MSCSCSRTHRVKPYETCIFCAHKHIAAALALRDESSLVGQLILASWHYRDDFPEMEAACIECAERIERAEPYRDSLAALCIRAWQMVLDNQESKAVYAAKSADDPIPFAPDAVAAHRAVAAANALHHELNYRDINASVTIGQLIIAAWHFDEGHHELAVKCRECWQKIERLKSCREELEALQRAAWEAVKIKWTTGDTKR